MIDWRARIDDLAGELAREHTMRDRVALEVLLAGLIDCPRTPATWIILETNWYSRECLEAWFSFGETWSPQSLRRLRNRSPWRAVEKEIDAYLESPSEAHLYIEPEWEKHPRWFRGQGMFILERSLRVRTRAYRVDSPLRDLDFQAEQRRQDTLAALTSAIVDDPLKARGRNPPKFVQPEEMLYYAELMQKLAPWYPDWRLLLRSLGALCVRHAYLYGYAETGADQDVMLARVAMDSIPPWITRAITALLEGPHRVSILEKVMGLEAKIKKSAYGPNRELARLRRAGILRWHPNHFHYSIVEEHREGLAKLLDGRAFGALPVAPSRAVAAS